MKLIADSGSTKTEWQVADDAYKDVVISTSGMNPVRDSQEICKKVLCEELLPALPAGVEVTEIHFFGAGCSAAYAPLMKDVLQQVFRQAQVAVESDILGAAIALCGDEAGIACILGTGSNSCLYDGKKIVKNVSPLGWILGDEGSGAVLGRTLVSEVLKNQLPEKICRDFYEYCDLALPEIITQVYREPQPNKFLASLVPFLVEHRADEEIKRLICNQFSLFIKRNVAQYQNHILPVHFVGGIAKQFEEELKQVVAHEGFCMGRIIKTPISALSNYFSLFG